MENQRSKIKDQNEKLKCKKIFLFLLCVFVFVLSAAPALADEHVVKPSTIPCPPNLPCITEETQEDPEKVREHVIGTFGTGFLKTFLGLAAVTAVIFIIVGGLQLHLAFGNEEAMTKAKKTLIWAIVGLVIAILSVAIVQITTKLFT